MSWNSNKDHRNKSDRNPHSGSRNIKRIYLVSWLFENKKSTFFIHELACGLGQGFIKWPWPKLRKIPRFNRVKGTFLQKKKKKLVKSRKCSDSPSVKTNLHDAGWHKIYIKVYLNTFSFIAFIFIFFVIQRNGHLALIQEQFKISKNRKS